MGPTYINLQDAFRLQTCLINMGNSRPLTKLQIDNTTAEALSKGIFKKKISKSIDMRFYCLQDRKTQVQFDIFWLPGNKTLVITKPSTFPRPTTISFGLIFFTHNS